MAGKNFDISRLAETITPVRSESDTMREIAIDKIRDNPRNFYPAPGPAALAGKCDGIPCPECRRKFWLAEVE